MEKYGTDKPDLRNPLIMQDATELFRDSDFKAFAVWSLVCGLNDRRRVAR